MSGYTRFSDYRPMIEGAVAPASTCNCTSCLKWLTFLMRRPNKPRDTKNTVGSITLVLTMEDLNTNVFLIVFRRGSLRTPTSLWCIFVFKRR